MIRLFILAMLLVPTLALAQSSPQTRIYDERGRSIGTATTDSQGSVRFRDERGNSLGTSSRTGEGTTNFYDARGNRTGSTGGRNAHGR
jgi:hypothetical protein